MIVKRIPKPTGLNMCSTSLDFAIRNRKKEHEKKNDRKTLITARFATLKYMYVKALKKVRLQKMHDNKHLTPIKRNYNESFQNNYAQIPPTTLFPFFH